MKKNWFITGTSRGFGKILALELLKQGCRVMGTTRDGMTDIVDKNFSVFKLDVTNEIQVKFALQAAKEWLGTIDVIVNNAGFGIVGALEEVSDDEARHVFDTNVFGTLNVLRGALPILRAQKSGHIVNFSSVGGFAGSAGFGIYNATKFAVEGLSEALFQEVKPFNVGVTIVEPGGFRTDFLTNHSLVRAESIIDDYTETSGKMRQYADERNGLQPSDPVAGMKLLIKAINEENPTLRLPLGQDCINRMSIKLQSVTEEVSRWSFYTKDVEFRSD
ncbi:SDR family NAD(P)-dependent oxidoreductase [Rheinheimera sp. MM224]|uniref:SDR family NAD(P)-dependent oxidoreductase n=1 Tax=Rheinheimera sp. MM224 TaxID=3019969 RepID=UPI0021F86670|nr:SDR family NAD(P)-dependent oxidoreductase [Rheinheimera sp. MM224]CAI3798317.1 3-phenylpropionate-dihydrodiol/cinnamic acid-dihydrodiol dehydrogenase [Rheinheimera sp. MM224]